MALRARPTRRAREEQRPITACLLWTSSLPRVVLAHRMVAAEHFSRCNLWSNRCVPYPAASFTLTCSHRTVTFSLAPRPSSRSRLRLRSLARSSTSSHTWSQSNERQYSASMPTHSTSRRTSEVRSASCSSIMRAFRATGGLCSKSLVCS